ncbi:hypothetical protein Nepgr_007995 [Nepenthes gracilis]|uniref:Uncharacterized protein n=1 Tax=Nepenthes gracilis TaxID=150966 RepID=A0AAD3S800_NEPGR|nr:hypothetical protein Nepgr_007995 [Nepenthes gracilis]
MTLLKQALRPFFALLEMENATHGMEDSLPVLVLLCRIEMALLKPSANASAERDLSIEVTIEYQRKLVRCRSCQKVGHSFSQPKKMYKATGRMLPLPPSSPGPAIKNPSSPKEIVKEHHAAISTSNSFEILLEEDVMPNLGLNYFSTSTDSSCQYCWALRLGGASYLRQCRTSLGLPSGIPNSCEEMTIKSAPLGSLSPSSILHSDDPDGGPPGRSTRARKAKRSTQVGTASGSSIPVPGNARKVQEQTKKINEILKNSKGPKSSIPPSSMLRLAHIHTYAKNWINLNQLREAAKCPSSSNFIPAPTFTWDWQDPFISADRNHGSAPAITSEQRGHQHLQGSKKQEAANASSIQTGAANSS